MCVQNNLKKRWTYVYFWSIITNTYTNKVMQMQNTDRIQRVITWCSRKNTDGTYSATAFSFDYNVPNVVHNTYIGTTRARATYLAKQSVRQLIAIRRATKGN